MENSNLNFVTHVHSVHVPGGKCQNVTSATLFDNIYVFFPVAGPSYYVSFHTERGVISRTFLPGYLFVRLSVRPPFAKSCTLCNYSTPVGIS